MPKRSKYPRLRVHVRRGRSGQCWTSWWFDMRPEGKPDVPLGNDYAKAIEQWDALFHYKPRVRGTLQEAFDRWRSEKLPAYTKETRRVYTQQLRTIEKVFGPATWSGVEFTDLCAYLDKRSAKTQANRELAVLSIVWNQARKWGLTKLPWPAAGMEKSRWKNKETPRRVPVTDQVFDAIYAEGEPMLRDCMDLASATSMRLTDCRTVAMPSGDVLHIKASKTGKEEDFDISLSVVLPSLLMRRRALAKAPHTMLLSMPDGKPVTEAKLRGAYNRARSKAAAKARAQGELALAATIEAMYLRDCRKYAAKKAGSLVAAQELLGHDNKRTTAQHYYFEPTKKAPVR